MPQPLRTHAPTRLVADGRLAVRVPAAWPRSAKRGVSQSCVLAMTLPVLRATVETGPGAIAVMLGLGTRGSAAPSMSVVDGATIERHVHDCADGMRTDRIDLLSPDLGGSICLSGDRALALAVAATAQPLPDGMVAVPNVWQASAGDDHRPTAEGVEALVAAAGLRAVVDHHGRHSTRDQYVLGACDPMVGEVLPVGSDVRITFST